MPVKRDLHRTEIRRDERTVTGFPGITEEEEKDCGLSPCTARLLREISEISSLITDHAKGRLRPDLKCALPTKNAQAAPRICGSARAVNVCVLRAAFFLVFFFVRRNFRVVEGTVLRLVG